MKKTGVWHNIFFAYIVLLFASCTGGSQEPSEPLQLSDLKINFIDYYELVYNPKEALVANNVDTMFLINDFVMYNMEPEWTKPYYAYDENGRPLGMSHGDGWGHRNHCRYDSTGLLKNYLEASDIAFVAGMSYRFEADSLLLYQYIHDIIGCRTVNDFFNYADTAQLAPEPYSYVQFKFDKQGKVLEEKHASMNEEKYPSKDITIYKYNDLGQPIYTQTSGHGTDADSIIKNIGHRNYYYTNGKLDSVISQYTYHDKIKPTKMYYDKRGLCYRVINTYGRTYNCIYKQRK